MVLKFSQDQMLSQTKPLSFWTSLGDYKLGREVQSIRANDRDSEKEGVHSDTCGAWFLRRAFCQKGGITFPPQT